MPFNSWGFIVFVCFSLLFYYTFDKEKHQKIIITLASYAFYAYSQSFLLFILLASSGVNYYLVRKIISGSKTALYLGVIANLAVLCLFKYATFFGKAWLGFFSFPLVPDSLLNLPFPIGISFYTFTAISLLLDTHKNSFKSNDSVSFLDVCFFISFFPKLILGPITKKDFFFRQFNSKKISDIDLSYVVEKLIVGFFLKMVIADNLHNQTFWIQNGYFDTRSSIELIVLLLGYSIQFFADFAGYSLIAIGIAGIFGYKLPDNFKFPYIATSVTEFWQRWHITLSAFLKEYLYIPLGGNQKGKFRTYFNLMVTMFLCGLWHGTGYNYILWGSLHGLVLIIERPFIKKKGLGLPKNVFFLSVQWALTFLFVSVGWIFFKLTDCGEVFRYLSMIFQNTSYITDYAKVVMIASYSLPVIVYHILYLYIYQGNNNLVREAIFEKSLARLILLGIMVFLIVFNSGSGRPFVYFQF